MGCGASLVAKAKEKDKAIRRRHVRQYRREILRQQYSTLEVLDDERLSHTIEVLSAMSVPVIAWCMDGTIVHVNETALIVLERDEESLRVGNHISKLLDLPEDLCTDEYYGLLETKQVAVRVLRGSGSIMTMSLSTSAVEYKDKKTRRDLYMLLGVLHPTSEVHEAFAMPLQEEVFKCDDVDALSISTSTANVNSHHGLGESPLPLFASSANRRLSLEELDNDDAQSRDTSPLSMTSTRSFRNANQVRFNPLQISDDAHVLMEGIDQPLMLVGSNGQIVTWNTGCQRVFGPTASEMIGHNLDLLIPHPFHEWHKKYLTENLKSRAKVKEGRISSKPRKALLSQGVKTVGRRIDSPSQQVLRKDFEEDPLKGRDVPEGPQLIPLSISFGEVWVGHCDRPFWFVMCTEFPKGESLPTSVQIRMDEATLSTNEHPAVLPAERPLLDESFTRTSSSYKFRTVTGNLAGKFRPGEGENSLNGHPLIGHSPHRNGHPSPNGHLPNISQKGHSTQYDRSLSLPEDFTTHLPSVPIVPVEEPVGP